MRQFGRGQIHHRCHRCQLISDDAAVCGRHHRHHRHAPALRRTCSVMLRTKAVMASKTACSLARGMKREVRKAMMESTWGWVGERAGARAESV